MAQNTDQAVGLVESIEGLVTVLHADGAETELALGSPLYLNDQITTGESAAVSVRFVDRTSFSIGEDSRLTIDEYIYDPTTAEGKVDISVLKGMFVFISGLVADENPQNMTISTPGATIGIRGTEGGGEIGEAGESSYYFNADGIIEIITPVGSVIVDETMEVAVVSPAGTPTLATGWSAEQIIETFVSALRVAPLEISQRIINADGNLNVDAREYIERLVQQASDRDSGDGASDDQDDQPESDDQGAGDADADAQEASGEEEEEGEESQTTLADGTTVEADSSAVALDISFGGYESQSQEYDQLAQQDNASELVNSSPGSVAGASEDTSDADADVDVDVDEIAPVFSSGSATVSLAENAAVNAVVYNAQASDNNGAAGITYSLSGAAAFSIDAASGAVSLNTGLDFEAQSSYALVVTATDAAGNQATQAVTVTVTDVDEAPTGLPTITGTVTQGETLIADASGITDPDGPETLVFSYQWQAGGNDISGATGDTFVLTQAQVGETITVTVSYTDGGGTDETLTSAATSAVTNTNDDPVGLPTITGTATQGETLTADTSGITDADGPETLVFSYQWQAGGNDISGATGSTFELTQEQVGDTITVTVSYTDGGNTAETLTSAATSAVTNTNDDPDGAVTISGTASEGETLTADTSAISDADGLGAFSYQWQADGSAINGATGASFELTQEQVGDTITVTVSYTDGGNTAETLTSAATNAVTNTNDDPAGLPTITGTATQGETLTADASGITDADGLGAFSYQWQADGSAINGATGASFELTQAQVGETITVTVSYTDGGNTAETLTSAATNAVTNTNDDPTGLPTITGTATQGETLTADTSAISDADGPETLVFSYQWQAGGNDISGATGASFELTQAQVGETITVTVSYTDGGGTDETLTSAATAAVTNENDPTTGAVTIDGTATQGETLTADTSAISDADGPETLVFSYQWQAGGNDITGATGSTFELTQEQVGETITVTVSYTDGGNTAETLTSAATNAVTNTNDDPAGLPSITGTVTQGETLTADTSAISDADGLGAFSYQWQADGSAINGATGASFELTQEQVGDTITVTVSYTDGGNTAETLTSAATSAVTNTNDDPDGAVTISGTASEGETLTADTSGITDADGPETLVFSYQWQAGGNDISGATGSTFELTQEQVGDTITVTVSYTDGGNTAETLTSAATSAVTNTNDDPDGAVTISGTASEGETLTADTSGITDADGPETLVFSYQWQAGGNDISGATGSTFELTQEQVGDTITVTVSYTDGGNTAETLTSAATSAVTNTNDDPDGAVTISGTASEGETLTADTSGITDADGPETLVFSYQWQAGGNDISGATGSTFELTQEQVGDTITVTVSYTDGGNTAETLTSAATSAVTNTNDDPDGAVTISGTASEGETLTADTSGITDADGPETLVFSYQWQAGGNDISGATGSTFELTQEQVGDTITVTVSYTDGGNTAETLTSAATSAVTNTNDDPDGAVTISGTASEGETLTADTSGITDADGPETLVFSYQWQAGGNDISGATGSTFELTQEQVGDTITVTVSYTDGGNTAETLTSAATNAVTNTNDDPVGLPNISGRATQGATLTADTSGIVDVDGLGSFSYQWQADGRAIRGADEATFVPTQAQVGAAITVTVSYTDDGNTAESLTSVATPAVTDEIPPVFSGDDSARLPRNAAEFVPIYNAQASDNNGAADAGITYSLGEMNTPDFRINPDDGEVSIKTTGSSIKDSYVDLKVTATDAAGNQATKTVPVTVTAADNTVPVFSSAATVNVVENTSINTVVYDAQARDAGQGPDVNIFYGLEGADATAFKIDVGSGEVRLRKTADFETKNSYALEVIALDAAGNKATQAVTVTVIDVEDVVFTFEEHRATDVILHTVSAAEGVAIPVFNFVHSDGEKDTTSEDGNLIFRNGNKGEIFFTQEGTISEVNNHGVLTSNINESPYTVEVTGSAGTVEARTLQFVAKVTESLAPYFVDSFGAPLALPTATAPQFMSSLIGDDSGLHYSKVFSSPVYVADEENGISGYKDSSGKFVYSGNTNTLTRTPNTDLQDSGSLNNWAPSKFIFGGAGSRLIFRFGDSDSYVVPDTNWTVTNPAHKEAGPSTGKIFIDNNDNGTYDEKVDGVGDDLIANLVAGPGQLRTTFQKETSATTDDVSALLQSLHFGYLGQKPTEINILVNDGDSGNPDADNDVDHTSDYSVAVV